MKRRHQESAIFYATQNEFRGPLIIYRAASLLHFLEIMTHICAKTLFQLSELARITNGDVTRSSFRLGDQDTVAGRRRAEQTNGGAPCLFVSAHAAQYFPRCGRGAVRCFLPDEINGFMSDAVRPL